MSKGDGAEILIKKYKEFREVGKTKVEAVAAVVDEFGKGDKTTEIKVINALLPTVNQDFDGETQ